jgi:hypothetical protein
MIRLVSRSRYVYRKRDVIKDVYLLAANSHQMTSYILPWAVCYMLQPRPSLLVPTDHPFRFKYGLFLVKVLFFQISFNFPIIGTEVLAKFTISKIALLWSENILNCKQSKVYTFSDPTVFKMINRCALV